MFCLKLHSVVNLSLYLNVDTLADNFDNFVQSERSRRKLWSFQQALYRHQICMFSSIRAFALIECNHGQLSTDKKQKKS